METVYAKIGLTLDLTQSDLFQGSLTIAHTKKIEDSIRAKTDPEKAMRQKHYLIRQKPHNRDMQS